jgi:tetrahydromethanopterin S-methyltransferase subunit B
MREPAEYDVFSLEERLRQLHVVVDDERVATFFKRTAERVSASFDVRKLRARIGKLEAVIDDLMEFVDEYSDVVDGDDGDPEPNQAMSLITMARDVLEGRTL